MLDRKTYDDKLSINRFSGKYSFLSNFSPASIKFDDEYYPSVEHAYQAAKTESTEEREKIRILDKASDAKRVGRTVKVRDCWDEMKLDLMEELLIKKFSIPWYADLLDSTGELELVEGNWWKDTYWGVYNGVGENHLGKLLMKIRELNRNVS